MPNVNSNGKFGTSLDHSQLMDIRKKYKASNFVSFTNPQNSPLIKPRLNMDKNTRGLDLTLNAFGNRGLFKAYKFGNGQ